MAPLIRIIVEILRRELIFPKLPISFLLFRQMLSRAIMRANASALFSVRYSQFTGDLTGCNIDTLLKDPAYTARFARF